MIGKIIGEKYVLLEKIGQGGGGSVYKARDLRLGKQWAVKLLGAGKGQEAGILKKLDHSMIPRVVDCLEEDGDMWLVMDYIQGRNLMEMHRKGGLSKKALLGWALDLCQVLAYLHGLDPPYVHGDLKPENLMASWEGKLFLVDFGAGAGRRGGVCEGTPGFAAPEQSQGIVTFCSDIYAFGKTWELLLGPRAGPKWKRILKKCCRSSPEKRYQQIQEVEKRLLKMKDRGKNPWLFPLLAGALAVCGASGYSAGNGMLSEKAVLARQDPDGRRAAKGEGEEDEKGRWKELGDLAEELGRGAGIQNETVRKKEIQEAAGHLEIFYTSERQPDRKRRAGLLLARAYREEDCLFQSEELYRELIDLYPDSAEVYGSYGCMLLEAGARQEQLESLYRIGQKKVSDKEEYNYRIWTERMENMEE